MTEPPSGLAAALAGRYALERELGQGGMATVYLARDLRHDRWVALKLLRPDLAAVMGGGRFLSEIKTTANLQHPHLLPLFDSGEAGGQLFYVMPYVEGESLRDRLERERQLPVEEAVRIASAVASALDYAHRHGVIHRDLKPENILLHEGQPLVADFGIALAVSAAGGARITQTGVSLGTPQYMSPEQATGDRVIDARTDIYALGALTYEMLVGDPPHLGSTAQASIAKLLTEEPRSIRAQRPSVPEHVELAVMKALERLPADRFGTAGEFGEAVTGVRVVSSRPSPGRSEETGAAAPMGRRRSRLREGLPWLGAGAAVTALTALFVATALWPSPPSSPLVRLTATASPGEAVGSALQNDPDLTISADGRRLAWAGQAGGQRLFLRALDELTATALDGTEGARTPFFSPDGGWIGYFDAALDLNRMPAMGGSAVTVLESVDPPRGASWGPDDAIVVATTDPSTGLLRVPASGASEPEVLTTPDPAEGELDHVLPEVLPDGRAVLFTVLLVGGGSRIEVLDLASGQRKVLVEGGSQPRYAASGHLVYASQGTLQAVAFDADRLQVTDDAVTVSDNVVVKGGGAANYALSSTGVLAYQAGGAGGQARLAWVDREGREELMPAPPRAYTYPRLSPDGSRIALDVRDQDRDIWVWDLARQTLTRITFDPALDLYPVWTPDGRHVVFASQRAGAFSVYQQAADGTGEDQLLSQGSRSQLPYSFTPDGSRLVTRQDEPGAGFDLRVLAPVGPGGSGPLLATPFNELNGELSPDGRWLAYQSNESGQDEIYVRPFPEVDAGRWQVSTGGGTRPLWSRDRRELFYLAEDGRLTSVPVEGGGPTFASGSPVRLLERAYLSPAAGRTYDVSPDGRRFLMIKEAGAEEGGASSQLVIVLNWFEELKRLVPAGGGGR